MKDDSLARRSDPWSSKEVGPIEVHLDLFVEIERWMLVPSVRGCERMCRWASDFEITLALLPLFPEIYEGEIRRQMRIFRKNDKRVITAPKRVHQHFNGDTHRWVQCHRILVPRILARQPVLTLVSG